MASIYKAEVDDIQLVLTFWRKEVPDTAYVNQQQLTFLRLHYDNNLVAYLKDVRDKVDVFFLPNDDKTIPAEAWLQLCDILEEYRYSMDDAKVICQWIIDNVEMDDRDLIINNILQETSNA